MRSTLYSTATMAKIDYAFVCGGAAQQHAAHWDFQVVGIRALNLTTPAIIEIIVVANITWSDEDLGNPNTVSVVAEDPLDQEVASTSTIIAPYRRAGAHPEDEVSTMVVQPLVFDVVHTGRYLIRAKVGATKYSLSIRVREQ